jgi:antitoxin component YwqK of YwqJK toxin-antitoxin module
MNRFLWSFFAFLSCSQNRVPGIYVNADAVNLLTHQGITSVNGRLFSGWAYTLFSDGDTASVTPYCEGKEEGVSRKWYNNKQLKETRFYHAGRKEGEHFGWYPNGIHRFIYHYNNDLFHGNVKEWSANGTLYRDFNYAYGYEAGLQKMWESDGRLKANYEVREGRKYGLTGSKNCLSATQ